MKISIDKHDTKWSKMAREKKPYCQNCLTKLKVLNAHHIMPRGRMSTRLDLSNALVLCVSCHVFDDTSVHKSPEGSKKFCVRIIGLKEWNRLEKLSLQYKSKEKAIKEFIAKYEKD